LAYIYENEKKDLEIAMEYYNMAIGKKNTFAMLNLGFI
jgi:hypothetical protein